MSVATPIVYADSITQAVAQARTGFDYSGLLVVIDAEVQRLYGPTLQAVLPTHSLVVQPSGEAYKDLAHLAYIWQAMYDSGLDRQGLVLAIGGGVVTDMAGFAASTWKRGLQYVSIPTTLLCMVDACYGGKTGIDFSGGKNLIGTFAHSARIVICTAFLGTLDKRQVLAGYAEMLKHAIVADANLWNQLCALQPSALTPAEWQSHIHRALHIKAHIVAEDPTERGCRATLNFGHTLGHALESAKLHSPTPLLHGEAVAWGMLLEARLAVQHAGLSAAAASEIEQTIRALDYYMPAHWPNWSELLPHLLQDKKNQAGILRFALPTAIGQAKYNIEIPLAVVAECYAKWLAQ